MVVKMNSSHTVSWDILIMGSEISLCVPTYMTQWIRDCSCFICLSDLSAITALKYSAICNKHRPIQLISCFEPVNMVLWLKCLNSGDHCVSHFHVSHFWCWVFKEMGPSIQQEGIPSSSDINNIPNITPITWGRRNGEWAWKWCQGDPLPRSVSYPEILRVNSAHQGDGNAVCRDWRTLSE